MQNSDAQEFAFALNGTYVPQYCACHTKLIMYKIKIESHKTTTHFVYT